MIEKDLLFIFIDVAELWHLREEKNKKLFTLKQVIALEKLDTSRLEFDKHYVLSIKRSENPTFDIEDYYNTKKIWDNVCDNHTDYSSIKICPNDIANELHDSVEHPAHYTDGNIEVIDYIEDKKLGFCLGNAIKYISRAGKKDRSKEIEDLEKAIWYINRRISELRGAKVW